MEQLLFLHHKLVKEGGVEAVEVELMVGVELAEAEVVLEEQRVKEVAVEVEETKVNDIFL